MNAERKTVREMLREILEQTPGLTCLEIVPRLLEMGYTPKSPLTPAHSTRTVLLRLYREGALERTGTPPYRYSLGAVPVERVRGGARVKWGSRTCRVFGEIDAGARLLRTNGDRDRSDAILYMQKAGYLTRLVRGTYKPTGKRPRQAGKGKRA